MHKPSTCYDARMIGKVLSFDKQLMINTISNFPYSTSVCSLIKTRTNSCSRCDIALILIFLDSHLRNNFL